MSKDAEPPAELVITAPEPYGAALAYRARCRTTLGALTQLLAHAKRHVIIAAPFLQTGAGLSAGPLAEALRAALQRGVDVDIVSTGQGLQTLNVAALRQGAQGRVRLFRSSANLEDEQRLGSHAKFCVNDVALAYIGSANLTRPGLDEQFEMGVLVRGAVARQVWEFWDYLLEVGMFCEV